MGCIGIVEKKLETSGISICSVLRGCSWDFMGSPQQNLNHGIWSLREFGTQSLGLQNMGTILKSLVLEDVLRPIQLHITSVKWLVHRADLLGLRV